MSWLGLGAAPPQDVVSLIESDDVSALRAITDIDGIPVDMTTLVNASDPDLVGRLATLKSFIERSFLADNQVTANPGEVARTVLEQSKYDLGGESTWDRLGALLLAWFDQFIDWLTSALGGPTNTALIFLAIVSVVGFVAFRFFARRRSNAIEREITLERLIAEGGDPEDLERKAADAAAREDFETAVRLRFLAGLLRLDLSGRITFRPGLTTGEIASVVDDRALDELVDDFNDVVYGGREARSDHYEAALAGWARVLTKSEVRA